MPMMVPNKVFIIIIIIIIDYSETDAKKALSEPVIRITFDPVLYGIVIWPRFLVVRIRLEL